jgi:hypothetical protein
LKQYLIELTTLTPPSSGAPLLLYVAASHAAVSAALVQEKQDGQAKRQVPVYFVSKVLSPSKKNYTELEKVLYAVLMAPRKLQHYFQSYHIIIHSSKPLKDITHTRQAAPTGTLARPIGQRTGPTCFNCSQVGHYANAYPMGNSGTPSQNKQQTPTSGKGFSIARVNQVSAEATADGVDIAIGMFYINAIPAAILFYSGATHSFISARYATTNELPLQTIKTPIRVITPKGHVEANYMTQRLTLTIMGRKFWSTPIVFEESSIDLILGMSWLRKAKAVIHCAKGTVELTSSKDYHNRLYWTFHISSRWKIRG